MQSEKEYKTLSKNMEQGNKKTEESSGIKHERGSLCEIEKRTLLISVKKINCVQDMQP